MTVFIAPVRVRGRDDLCIIMESTIISFFIQGATKSSEIRRIIKKIYIHLNSDIYCYLQSILLYL